MKTSLFAFAAVSIFACACSSSPPDPFGPPPDFNAINAQFQHPSGTFAAGSESSVLAAYGSQSKNGQGTSGLFGGAAPAASGQSTPIHPLAGTTAPQSFCQVGAGGANGQGSCTCPGGGDLQWDFAAAGNQSGGTAILKLLASGCKTADGATSLDGKAFVDVNATTSQGTTSNGTTTTSGNVSIIYDAHFAYVANGQSGRIDMEFEDATIGDTSTFGYLVTVNDGSVVVGGTWDAATKTGDIVVVDKVTTWKCTGTDGKTATCTDTQGDTRTAQL